MSTTRRIGIALAAVALLGACGTSQPAPTVTVTQTAEAPAPASPDTATVAGLYSTFLREFKPLTDEFVTAASASDYAGAADILEQIGTKASEGLALPDLGIPTVDAEWAAAMQDYMTCAAIGAPAIRSMDATGMTQATVYLNRATGHIKNINAALTS